MSISSISSSAVAQAAAVSQVAPSTVAASSASTDVAAPSSTSFSQMGQLMSQLQSLEQTDPDKAKTVLAKIGSDLSSTNPQLAAKFNQASQTGDLSALQPSKGAGGHHHHHHGGGGGGSPTSPTAQASAYDQSSDPMAQVESVISNALDAT
ncbi:MAG TPA: hypothetical protein VGG74_20165 [Kofleriaceae bacterium]|jgi:hypothetical protein